MAAGRDHRPLSPHLQVYRLPLNAILSITHRLTGLLLMLGAVFVVVLLIAAASGSQPYLAFYVAMTSWAGQVLLFIVTFALYMHLCTGIRHLFWDAGFGFELRASRRNGWIVIVASVVLAVLTWVLAVTVGG